MSNVVDLDLGGAYSPPPGRAVDLDLGPPVPVLPGLLLSSGPVRAAWGRVSTVAAASTAAPWGRVSTTAAHQASAPWQRLANLLPRTGTAAWGAAAPRSNSAAAPWQSARLAARPAGVPWQRAGIAQRGTVATWGRALSPAVQIAAPWQASVRAQRAVVAPWQASARALRAFRAPWGVAHLVVAPNDTPPPPPNLPLPPRVLQRLNLHLCAPLPRWTAPDTTATAASRWGTAWGRSWGSAWGATARPAQRLLNLALGVNPCTPPAQATYTIAARGSYMQHHTITAQRLPDGLALPFTQLSLTTDDSSFGWTFSGTGPEALLDTLAPVGGVPARVRVTVDGIAWEVLVEGRRRNRAFGQRSATITARSTSMLLADPYMPERAWLNSVPMTAAQLAADALDGTGVGLDWRCTDWLVPGGAWTHTGTAMSAVRRIAESIGAVVASPRTGDVLIVRPRYAVLPWAWGSATPDVVLASLDPLLVEGYEQADRPAYDGVYISGQAQGVLGLVKRAGSGPSMYAPMVTDALATHLDAVRQRGESILGAAGPHVNMSLSLPLLTGAGEPGVIEPGLLMAVGDPDEPWRGLVRGCTISVSGATVSQALTLERHL